MGSAVRRLLLVSHVFPPLVGGGAPRMGQFARLLPDFGWDVTVITAKHTSSGVDAVAREALAGKATILEAWSPASAVVKRNQPARKRGIKGAIRKVVRTAAMSLVFPDREIFWALAAIRIGQRALRETQHDVVLASHGPASNLVVGLSLAKQFGLPLVADFRDLWSTLPMPNFTTPVHRAAARQLERSVVRAAARVVAVAPKMAQELARTHGIDESRAVSITNGFDPADLVLVHDARPTNDRPFRLVYTGSVNTYHDMEPFWLAIRRLADERKITPETFRIEFVGNLAMDFVEKYQLEALVETSPFVPHDQVFNAFARADALLVVETPGYYASYSYAAKLFDYLLTGKPVVALVEAAGNSWTLLTAAGVGHFAEPDDIGEICRAIESVLPLKGATPRNVDGGAVPYRAFNRRHLVERLATMLDDVADGVGP